MAAITREEISKWRPREYHPALSHGLSDSFPRFLHFWVMSQFVKQLTIQRFAIIKAESCSFCMPNTLIQYPAMSTPDKRLNFVINSFPRSEDSERTVPTGQSMIAAISS